MVGVLCTARRERSQLAAIFLKCPLTPSGDVIRRQLARLVVTQDAPRNGHAMNLIRPLYRREARAHRYISSSGMSQENPSDP